MNNFTYGRCRSGKRYFWTVHRWDDHAYFDGYSASEGEAIRAARKKVHDLAQGKPYEAFRKMWVASSRLKEINKAKRAARPASKAKGSTVVEYLYSYEYAFNDDNSESHVYHRYGIIKKTAKRIYYDRRGEYRLANVRDDPWRKGHLDNNGRIGFVDREKLELEGRVYNNGRHWSDDDSRLFLRLEDCTKRNFLDEVFDGLGLGNGKPNLKELKAAMIAAHPDKGGSSAAFIAARRRYMEAKRRAA
jgi:hypothetical protein